MTTLYHSSIISYLVSIILSCTEAKLENSYDKINSIISKNELEDPQRPLFHYTAEAGFLSDPNGLIYNKGTYHLFHQYNPFDIRSGVPQHWAHAVSKDLVHWQRLPIAIYPHGGGNIWSGSAVVDLTNSAGLQTGIDPPLIAFYTWQKDFTQRMTYSNDNGLTWTEYSGNPVVHHLVENNRDPKVFWHSPTGKWIMILYTQGFEIFISDNLKKWTHSAYMNLQDFHECPDFFELPIDGNNKDTKWVVTDATGRYYIGAFDGNTFKTESDLLISNWSGVQKEFYATQTWSNIPPEDGRRIQIACMRDHKYKIPEEKFHNQMTFPCELTLRSTDHGLRLFRWPVKEIEQIYDGTQSWKDVIVSPLESVSLSDRRSFDLSAQIEFPLSNHLLTQNKFPYDALSISFNIRGIDVLYDVTKQEINIGSVTAPIKINKERRLDLRILVDKNSFEIFGNEGEMSISAYVNPAVNNHMTFVRSTGGKIRLIKLQVTNLKSIW